jgi:hypothetical protein
VTHPRQARLRAAVLLLGFVLAVVVGVLGHPRGEAHGHACDGQFAHLTGEPEHSHDEDACAGCHLFQSLSQATATGPAGSTLVTSAPGLVEPVPAEAPACELLAARPLGPRGPPAS